MTTCEQIYRRGVARAGMSGGSCQRHIVQLPKLYRLYLTKFSIYLNSGTRESQSSFSTKSLSDQCISQDMIQSFSYQSIVEK